MTPFQELIPGMEYEIHVGAKHYYRGIFKHSVDNLAYFHHVHGMFSTVIMYSNGQYFNNHRSFKKLKHPIHSSDKMDHHEKMKAVCDQIAEIKRVVKESKKMLTKEQRAEVRAYRHSMTERIQATHELHLARESSGKRITWAPTVFEEWHTIANSIPSNL